MLIQPLKDQDYASWSAQYVDYLKSWHEEVSTDRVRAVWSMLQDPGIEVHGLGCFSHDEVLLGFLHFVLAPCTYSRRTVCYLQDIYVVRDARRRGIAKDLIRFLEARGKASGWRSITWKTRPDNQDAIALYQNIARKSDWIYFELPLVLGEG